LATPASIAAQRELATSTTLAHAHRLVALFTPEAEQRTRAVAFFFDLVNQQGSMASVPVASDPNPDQALAFTLSQSANCYSLWKAVTAVDPLAAKLVYYAYARASQARAEYVWDSFSRRATIACRVGYVHESRLDLTQHLD
jgi:hypothetical protein